MSWGDKFYNGSMWLREKFGKNGHEILGGFADWGSVHMHSVVMANGSIRYNRVISGIDLLDFI